MRNLLILMGATFLMGCPHKTVLRDAEVYRTEIAQYDSWATQQAAYLRGFITEHCECDEAGNFKDDDCSKAADFVLVIEARHEWHLNMSLYNASLLDERPGELPAILPLTCPLPSSDEARIEAEEEAAETTDPDAPAVEEAAPEVGGE